MEIKNIRESADSIELQLEGSLNIKKDTIRDWYNRYCKTDPDPIPEPISEKLGLQDLIDKFNKVLSDRGYKTISTNTKIYGYIHWAYYFTDRLYKEGSWVFKPSTYPLVYDYRGANKTDDGVAYNTLQSWLMAWILSELVPDSGQYTNTQTELFKLACEISGGMKYPLYNDKEFKLDPYAMREAASVMYAICRGDSNIEAQIDDCRKELGGKRIPASCWSDLGYKNTMISDAQGRVGYRMDYLGYCINTSLFLPASPGPRIEGTTVCKLPQPWEQGQDFSLFNASTGNYLMDEKINRYFVENYNMMSQLPLSVWNSYPLEKRNRLVNVGAIPTCSYIYMFGKKNVKFDGIKHKAYGDNQAFDYYCFSQTSENTGLALKGPFSEFQGIYRYNANPKNKLENCIEAVTDILDNFRFPTEDPNYGRCRPGCKPTRQGGELNPVHGAAENEIYNVDLTTMVADNAKGKAKCEIQDGFASDSPRSYVSGHSAQIWGLALIFTQLNNGGNCEEWIRGAYEYSVSRSIGRFHWNSDCIYGRLIGALALPIMNAMSGLEDGMKALRDYILNPAPKGNWDVDLIIKNNTGSAIQSTGEIRLYVDNHIGINTYLPDAKPAAGALYTFKPGENNFSNQDVHCVLNGEDYMDDSYNGKVITDVRFYDQRHYNNIDAGFKASLDLNDSRCSNKLNKSGATYVIKIEKI